MDLYFITEARFVNKEGVIYTEGSFTKALWDRYLECFDNLYVIARVRYDSNFQGKDSLISSRDRVNFVKVPYYVGASDFSKKYFLVKKELKKICNKNAVYILRVPGLLGNVASRILQKYNKKYGVEVVGDPYDVFAPNGKLLQTCIRKYSVNALKRVVRNAAASLYVTKDKLQSRYPYAECSFTTHASNVILKDSLIESNPRVTEITVPRIVTIGMLSQMYKAPDVVIDALAILKKKKIFCKVTWVGDGRYKREMIQYALDKDVSDMIDFVGLIPAGEAVRNIIYANDLFILVSRTEGLPRALIEAMASGIYCIATRVGGIPELLNDEWLINPDNSFQLAESIERAIANPKRVEKQILQNLSRVKDYAETVLKRRREDFYNELIRISTIN